MGFSFIRFPYIHIAVFVIGILMAVFIFLFLFSEKEVQLSDTNVTQSESKAIITGLKIPWEVVFLEDNKALVTEREGELAHIDLVTGDIIRTTISNVHVDGEGGLLGMALHPNFEENNWLYLYHTTKNSDGVITNQVIRYVFSERILTEKKVIVANIPGAKFHNGGRIAFGPDGYLYITTGDALNPQSAQDTTSLAGKILRVTDEGDVPIDNPFINEVYSYGHRNSQGLAWDSQGTLWSTEHGRSNPLSGFDEVNKIEMGNNYGWPDSQGDEIAEDTVGPYVHSGAHNTWAPGGMIIVNSAILFAGLKGESIYMLNLNNDEREVQRLYKNKYGRIRNIVIGPDDALYILTSNSDGRGKLRESGDVLTRIEYP